MATDPDGYPCEPRPLRPGVWFYEQKDGIKLCISGAENGIQFGTKVFTLPWSRIGKAIDRHREIVAISSR